MKPHRTGVFFLWILKLWIPFVWLKWCVLIGWVLLVCAFCGIRPFILGGQIYVYRVFLSMPYHEICGVCSGTLFIPDFGNLGRLFYFSFVFLEVCELNWLLQRTSFLFHEFFLFWILLISALYFLLLACSVFVLFLIF